MVGGVQPEEHLWLRGAEGNLQLQPGARLHLFRMKKDDGLKTVMSVSGVGAVRGCGCSSLSLGSQGRLAVSPGHASRAQKPGRASVCMEVMTTTRPAGPGTEGASCWIPTEPEAM